MNQELFDYIQFLSKEDTKSLSQKALKASEEVGELAKAVLPFENAFATTHRFVEKRKILEEAIDTTLAALSCAYDLGFTHEDIESMVVEKSAKWRKLQVKAQGIQDPSNVPFEIHITVNEKNHDYFRETCKTLGVKSILLDLQTLEGERLMLDYQTSSVFFGDNRGALAEVERISSGLKSAHIEVVREKIETIPWHPAAPAREGTIQEMPKDCYFEFHAVVFMKPGQKEALRAIANKYLAHLSRNMLKPVVPGEERALLTYRSYDDVREDFEEMVNHHILPDLEQQGFRVEKTNVEFSIYDTNIKHDQAWIASRTYL